MTHLICITGPSCAGKSTLIDQIRALRPQWASIHVGRELRRRYPPQHFAGRDARADTEAEVWEIFDQQLAEARASGAPVTLVDGQPRLATHYIRLQDRDRHWCLIELLPPLATLLERARARSGADATYSEMRIRSYVPQHRSAHRYGRAPIHRFVALPTHVHVIPDTPPDPSRAIEMIDSWQSHRMSLSP